MNPEPLSNRRQGIIKSIARCPFCLSGLEWRERNADCQNCGKPFCSHNEVIDFTDNEPVEHTRDAAFQKELNLNRSFTAQIYNFGKKIISSEYKPRNHLKLFLKQVGADQICVELGSGKRRLGPDVINVDRFAFPHVDLLSDINQTPFADSSVDFVVLDSVLEHLPEPQRVVREIHRILKPGGKVLCITTFVFPYHGYPRHYFNFSKDGLEVLFQEYSGCEIEMHMGPASAIIHMISEYLSIMVSGGNNLVYTLCRGVVMLPIFLFKYLDRFWNPKGRVVRISSMLCAVATK